jgi:hypothetical protein
VKRKPFLEDPMAYCITPREEVSAVMKGWAAFGPYKATPSERVALVPIIVVIAILALALGVHLLA